jgi:hypothetical protein
MNPFIPRQMTMTAVMMEVLRHQDTEVIVIITTAHIIIILAPDQMSLPVPPRLRQREEEKSIHRIRRTTRVVELTTRRILERRRT